MAAEPEPEVVDAQPMSRAEVAANAGRHTFKLTDEKLARIVELVKVGNYAEVACASVGISENSYYRWLRTGKTLAEELVAKHGDDHQLHELSTHQELNEGLGREVHHNDYQCWKLREAVNRAEGEAESWAVTTLRKHMADNPRAVIDFLERRHSKRWRRRDQHEVVAGIADAVAEEQGMLESAEAQEHLEEALRAASRKGLPHGDPPTDP